MKIKNIRFIYIVCVLLFISILSTGCSGSGSGYTDGTYEGISNNGMHGEVKVKVTVKDSNISGVEVTSHNETESIGTVAVEQLPDIIIESQSTEVDSVSGATMTSTAIKEAVNDALTKAE